MTISRNIPAQRLRRTTSPEREPRNYCPSCERTVEPRIDSQGPYCPFCHQNIAVPMERECSRIVNR